MSGCVQGLFIESKGRQIYCLRTHRRRKFHREREMRWLTWGSPSLARTVLYGRCAKRSRPTLTCALYASGRARGTYL